MGQGFFFIALWSSLAALLLLLPLFWAIAFKWTNSGDQISYVVAHNKGNAVGFYCSTAVICFFYGFGMAMLKGSEYLSWTGGALAISGFALHYVIRVPILFAFLAYSCEATYNDDSESSFVRCASVDKTLMLLGFYFDYVLFGIYGIGALACWTVYAFMC